MDVASQGLVISDSSQVDQVPNSPNLESPVSVKSVTENKCSSTSPNSNRVIEVPASPHMIDPVLIKTLAENGSPVVLVFLLCCFFRILTRFVEVCKEE